MVINGIDSKWGLFHFPTAENSVAVTIELLPGQTRSTIRCGCKLYSKYSFPVEKIGINSIWNTPVNTTISSPNNRILNSIEVYFNPIGRVAYWCIGVRMYRRMYRIVSYCYAVLLRLCGEVGRVIIPCGPCRVVLLVQCAVVFVPGATLGSTEAGSWTAVPAVITDNEYRILCVTDSLCIIW